MELQRGDVFCVASEGALGSLIRLVTRWQSKDDKVEFNHSGIVLNPKGDTFEALWTAKQATIWHYTGRLIAIYRPIQTVRGDNIYPANKDSAIEQILLVHKGKPYPIHRLGVYFFLAPLMKYFTGGDFLMCSEMVAKYEALLKCYDGKFGGITPDDLVDRWRIARTHEKVFKGKLPANV